VRTVLGFFHAALAGELRWITMLRHG